MRVLIADGGTGGHIFPALAVAEELRKRKVEEILFTGTPFGLERDIVPRHGYTLELIHVGGLIGKNLLTRIKTLIQLPFSWWESRKIIDRFCPNVAIGFGAYASGPVLVAAYLQKVPILLVEPNAIPGFTNRIALRFATRVAVTYEDKAGVFRGKAVITGTPVRPLQRKQIQKSKFTVGILGGSQGARFINQLMVEALPALVEKKDVLHLIHQTGKGDFEKIRSHYQRLAPFFQVTPFIHDVEEFYNSCDLLVCRAGAITLAEITVMGKAAILIPLPTATHNHQEKNARRLEEAGAAKVLLQKDCTPQALLSAVGEFLNAPEKLRLMEEASQKMGRPDATQKVVDQALSIAK